MVTTNTEVLARECDRYAAHLTNRNAMLDAADLFARCAIALRQPDEPAGGLVEIGVMVELNNGLGTTMIDWTEARHSVPVGSTIFARIGLTKEAPAVEPAAEQECRYCKRPVDSQGGIFHEGDCAGLQERRISRLRLDWLREHPESVAYEFSETKAEK